MRLRRLTEDSLHGVGEVIAATGRPRILNGGASQKWDRLVPTEAFDGPMNLGLLRTRPGALQVTRLERHVHTHQFFVPMAPLPYVVVVAGNDPTGPNLDELAAFLCRGDAGVNFHPGTWHSPLIVVREAVTFLTAMRQSVVPDIDLRELPHPISLTEGD